MSEPRFTDRIDREWKVSLDYPRQRTIKTKEGIDFGDTGKFGTNWVELMQNEWKCLNVIWLAVSEAPADADFDSFLSAMDGERLEAARDALFAALVQFASPRQREMLVKGHERLMRSYGQALAKAIETLSDLETEEIK
jgi:hypothetical protein